MVERESILQERVRETILRWRIRSEGAQERADRVVQMAKIRLTYRKKGKNNG